MPIPPGIEFYFSRMSCEDADPYSYTPPPEYGDGTILEAAVSEAVYLWARTAYDSASAWIGIAIDFTGDVTSGWMHDEVPAISGKGTIDRWENGSDFDPTDEGINLIRVTTVGIGANWNDAYSIPENDSWGVVHYCLGSIDWGDEGYKYMSVGSGLIVRDGCTTSNVYFGFDEFGAPEGPVSGISAGATTSRGDIIVVSTPLGACCVGADCVATTTQAVCTNTYGGDWYEGESCPAFDCSTPPPPGACCYPDGTCTDEPGEGNCTGLGGVWQGHGSDCATTDCPQPGACCLLNGNCVMKLEGDCLALWQGPGTACDPNPCVPGACCYPDAPYCEDGILVYGCTAGGGIFAGDDTSCDPNDCNANGVPDLCDIAAGTSTDYNGNGVPDEVECEGLGDLNGDGTLNSSDVDPFVLVMTDPEAFAQQYPDVDPMLADVNGDGSINSLDIDGLTALING